MKIETFDTRDEASDAQEYYESLGLSATWHKDASSGKYIVTTWED